MKCETVDVQARKYIFLTATIVSYWNGLHKLVRFHHYFLKVKFHCK